MILHPMTDIFRRNRDTGDAGVYSVCSAHPDVLDASITYAVENNHSLCIETTSNQVNQFGGYTGMRPEGFSGWIRNRAAALGLPDHKLWLGGDHLGPFPWRNESSHAAMAKSRELAASYVKAGYAKIHLDTSMACADDGSGPLADDVIAARTADMARVAEQAYRESSGTGPAPIYVIGTEVPVPGGVQGEDEEESLHVTTPEEAAATLQVMEKAFRAEGLSSAWERVIGLVVQPGVEFGDQTVHHYDSVKTEGLRAALAKYPNLVYEAHSTDYQQGEALKNLIGDHFAILKVGPWFTFALREALFSLSYIEEELATLGIVSDPSGFREAIFDEVYSNPAHWKDYYFGNRNEIRKALFYSMSDRIRYYWTVPSIQTRVRSLFNSLNSVELPATLVSQFFPDLMESDLADYRPATLLRGRIQRVNRLYSQACGHQD